MEKTEAWLQGPLYLRNNNCNRFINMLLLIYNTPVFGASEISEIILFLTITLANLSRFYNFYTILIGNKFYMRL